MDCALTEGLYSLNDEIAAEAATITGGGGGGGGGGGACWSCCGSKGLFTMGEELSRL